MVMMMINLFVWFFQCFVLCWWGERKGIWPVGKKELSYQDHNLGNDAQRQLHFSAVDVPLVDEQNEDQCDQTGDDLDGTDGNERPHPRPDPRQTHKL